MCVCVCVYILNITTKSENLNQNTDTLNHLKIKNFHNVEKKANDKLEHLNKTYVIGKTLVSLIH